MDETESDAAALGIVMPEQPPEDFEVWEENWPVVELFLRVQTQWRISMNRPIGLDYGAVAWILKLTAEETTHRPLLEELQIMEGAVLAYIAKQES